MTTTPSMNSSPALLLGEGVETRVVVHPLVLFHILDHHNRRNEAGNRVIGTLLGRKDENSGLVEITNAFSVPHAERGEEVAIGKDFNKTMLNLHLRASRKDTVVGWYASTSSEATSWIQDTSSLIHEFYATESDDGDPIHLVVDTRLLSDQLIVRAFKSTPVLLQGEVLGNLFHELSLTLQGTEPETIALREMLPQEDNNNNSSIKRNNEKKDPIQVSMNKLYDLLCSTCDYVDQVIDGKIPADASVGRKLADAMATVPSIQGEAMDKLFHESLQDLLMVTYLSNITQTQITIAEKLNAALGS